MTLTPVHRVDADVAIVGSGFAGALLALVLRQQGKTVALLERGTHPRFAIGESTTPLCNLRLEAIADRWALPRLKPFAQWGSWRAAYPDVACGLKRGFTFFRHDFDQRFTDDASHARQLLVAASPNDATADTHWYRPDFDHWLVREADAAGARYVDELGLDGVSFDGDRATLTGVRRGRRVEVDAGFVVDASGPRGFLATALGLAEPATQWLPATQGLYAHFTGVERWDALVPPDAPPPYPIDDAAVHHVFPGGWIWILRFGNGVTSAGAAVVDRLAAELRFAEGPAAWSRLLGRLPSIRDQFGPATAGTGFVHAPRIAFRTRQVVGPRWALLPSAAGVIDPLLSTGFALTLLGLERLAEILDGPAERRPEALSAYARHTQAELDATEQLVAALYAGMGDFPLFKRLALLYFAAASFSEAAHRLGHPARAPGFLLHADPQFGPALRRCVTATLTMPDASGDPRAARRRLFDDIDRAIEPFDIAGLLDRTRRDWYPVLASDLVAGADKLGASASDVRALLARSGF
jgi:FADH2 O2-dependent halogenase